MNNAVFGKNMKNVHNHIDVKLIIKWDDAEAIIAKPNFHSVFAKRRAIINDPPARWDRSNARNRSTLSFNIIAWSNPFPDFFFCFLGTIDINGAITYLYLYLLLLINRPCLCAFVASSMLLYCSYLPCRGDRREFSWKLICKDQMYRRIVRCR